jgi:APA family basic amino acid/polyamine antiporter
MAHYTLDATLVIATMFLGSAVAAAVLPWRRPDIYRASPIARNAVLGIPLIMASAGAFAVSLIFCLYQWISRDVYGIYNPASFRYLADLYALALVIYVGFRLYRRAQGMDLKMVYGEIPEE